MAVIVWEWESNPSLWLSYSPEVCHLLEDGPKNGKHVILIGHVDPTLSCYEVNLKTKEQTRNDTGTVRNIRRTIYPSIYPCSSGVSWEWSSEYGWTTYDMETSHHLESEHLKGYFLDLEKILLGIPNTVDFRKMVQVNKYTMFERPVRRTVHKTSYPADTSVHSSSLKSIPNAYSPSKSSGHKSSLPVKPAGWNSRSPSKTSGNSLLASKQGVSPATKPQHKAKQQLSYSGGATGGASSPNEKKSDEHKQKKVKLINTEHGEDPLTLFCRDAEDSKDEECSICFEKLNDVSGFHGNSSKPPDSDIKELRKCKHKFHGTCLLELIKSGSKNGWIQCPTCKAIHGIKHGSQPKEGTMTEKIASSPSLPGYHGDGMITITYNFNTGIQGKEHPHPGNAYYASGFPRICYLPNNKKGQKVLKLLRKAWQRRLVFTVATSNTTGWDDTVVWNEIHHKTEAFSNISGHGFPDPNYLDNVLAELGVQGVYDSDEDDDGDA